MYAIVRILNYRRITIGCRTTPIGVSSSEQLGSELRQYHLGGKQSWQSSLEVHTIRIVTEFILTSDLFYTVCVSVWLIVYTSSEFPYNPTYSFVSSFLFSLQHKVRVSSYSPNHRNGKHIQLIINFFHLISSFFYIIY